jgi:hypothetical protein
MKKTPLPRWIEDVPIYRQLMDLLVVRILDQTYPEGEMLPSVRQMEPADGVEGLQRAVTRRIHGQVPWRRPHVA